MVVLPKGWRSVCNCSDSIIYCYSEVSWEYLPGHDRKVTSHKKIVFIPYEGYKGGNRDYCSYFSVTFKITRKFLIVFVRLILGKVGIGGFTGPRRESDIRQENISIYHQGYKAGNRDYCSNFSMAFETTSKFLIIFVRLILGKMGIDGFIEPRRESDIKHSYSHLKITAYIGYYRTQRNTIIIIIVSILNI